MSHSSNTLQSIIVLPRVLQFYHISYTLSELKSPISLGSVLESPLLSSLDGTFLVGFPEISDLLIKRIVQVRKRHQSLDREEHGSNLECWRPLVFQNVQANSTQLVDIWVVDLGSEQNLWWHHWVLIRQEKLAIEESSLVWSFSWTSNLDVEMSVVLLIWLSIDSNNCIINLVKNQFLYEFEAELYPIIIYNLPGS